ncbi:MAG TPA: YlzJ-like family protein [Symbiobacteriaceae bacterium]|nr:YlzJ-like family protein [Symbiobacteriaceae bacterium]
MDSGAGILWTAMPLELVTEGLLPQAEACVEQTVEGRLLLVTPSHDGYGTVQRLLSTDPADYLDPRWQPGCRVPLGG